jgi:SAM-dependent methyltransferase
MIGTHSQVIWRERDKTKHMAWFFRKKQKSNQTSTVAPTVQEQTATLNEQYVGARRFVDAPDAPYQLPKDTTDLNRLDFQHFILRQAFVGNYVAPISLDTGSKLLDVGTGTGRWAIEMAQAFPQTRVYGVDLEESRAISGQTPSTPLNYSFQRGNVLQGLPFQGNTFDFVHQRLLVTGVPFTRWPEVIRELLRVTRHGGWIEMVEGGAIFVHEGPATTQWSAWSNALMGSADIDVYQIANLAAVAQQNGLICERRVYNIPIGSWGGRIGVMMQQDLLSIYDSLVPRYQQVLGISTGNTDTIRQRMIQEWNDLHTLWSTFVVYGQKGIVNLRT